MTIGEFRSASEVLAACLDEANVPIEDEVDNRADDFEEPAEDAPPASEEQPRAVEPVAAPVALRFQFLTAAELCAPIPPTNHLVKALDIGPGRPTKIVGAGGGAKSLACMSLGLSVLAGRHVWSDPRVAGSGFWTRQGDVAFFDYEMGRHPSLRRARRLAVGLDLSWEGEIVPRLRFAPFPRLYLNTEGVADHFKRAVDGCALAVIDSLRRALPGEDENDSQITRYLDVLTRVSDDTECTFLLTHHATTKGDPAAKGRDPRGAGRGSSALFDASGAELCFSGLAGEPIHVQQTRAGEGGTFVEPFYLAIEDVEVDGEPKAGLRIAFRTVEQIVPPTSPADDFKKTVGRVLACVEANPGIAGVDAVREHVGLARDKVRAAVETLKADGRIEDRGEKGRGGRQVRLYATAPAEGTS